MYQSVVKRFTQITFLIIFFLLSGCGDDQSIESSDTHSSNITLPRAITQARLAETGSLQAYLQVDDGSRQQMVVNGSNATIEISGLSVGAHEFTITIEYLPNSDPQNPVILTQTSKQVDIQTGANTPLSLVESDFSYDDFDDDNDGVSNLNEILINNAKLQSIVISAGSLNETFEPSVTHYTASVDYAVTSIQVTANPENSAASLTINSVSTSNNTPGPAIALEEGSNTVTVTVTSSDGSATQDYVVTITRAGPPANDATLQSLQLSVGSLNETFASDVIAYTAIVAYETSEIRITANPLNTNAVLKINDISTANNTPSATIALAEGNNTVTVNVTSEDGTTTKLYTLIITRAGFETALANANLQSLGLSPGTLKQTFDSTTTSYTASVAYEVSGLQLTASTHNSQASLSVSVNGVSVAYGNTGSTVSLAEGVNTVTVVVTAEDGTTKKTYTLQITRAGFETALANANLQSLSLSSGTLNEPFDSSTTSYTTNVAYEVTSLKLTANTHNSQASLIVNGVNVVNGSPSSAISLAEGANSITIVVTAEDGTTTKTSTLVVTRAGFETALANANLQSLSLSSGTLNQPYQPGFQSGVTSYSATVAYEVSNIQVTANPLNTNAALKINGIATANKASSAPIELVEGSNTITIKVISEDGSTNKIYSLVVSRAYSITATAGSNGAISPRTTTVNQGGTTSFTVTPATGYSIDSVTGCGGSLDGNTYTTGAITAACTVSASFTKSYIVTATAGSNGTISPGTAMVNEGGTTSFTVAPDTGYSIDSVTGCGSGSLSGNTYTTGAITEACAVNASFKVSASNTSLQSLELSAGSLTFAPQTTSYTLNVAYTVSSIRVTANPLNTNATLKINGVNTANSTPSASIVLNEGSNSITIRVTADDASTAQDYILNITRLAPTTTIANLNNLSLSTGELSPVFQSLQPYYSATVDWLVSSLQVNATTQFAGASLTINGVAAASGVLSLDIELSEGENLIEIIVTASDNLTQRRYTITLTRQTLQSFAQPLNDTGISWGGNYPSGNNTDCIGETIDQQDCQQGRDAQATAGTLSKAGAGHAGFDFTKLDASGNTLDATATSWSCVKDNVTGLIWEVKTPAGSGGMHDASNTYRWGGKTARLTGTFGTQYNDWDTLVDGSNSETLCGYSDWRVPSVKELEGLVNFNQLIPALDSDYFPNSLSSDFWSSSPNAGNADGAWIVYFDYGYSGYYNRTNTVQVRLVRGGE